MNIPKSICVMHKYLLIIIFLSSYQFVLAQSDSSIEIIACSNIDSVQLRWAPSSPYLWSVMREQGINLTRQTVMRDGKMLPLAERREIKIMGANPILPAPFELFEEKGMNDKYIAIGAQAIYGEDFVVETGTEGDDIGSLINDAREQDNRFSFGLFAADQSWEAAKLMGLAFTDKEVKRNETYVYKVRPQGTFPSLDTVSSGFIAIEVAKAVPPPPITYLDAAFDDRTAILQWSMEIAQHYYTSYFIERSTDGLNWERVNELPYVQGINSLDQSNMAYYQVKVPENNRPYFFRVIGKTPFGSLGPPSDPVQGMGFDPLPIASPSIASVFPAEGGGFTISWLFTPSEAKIDRFEVSRASSVNGEYISISGPLAPDVFNFTDENPLRSNYYRVTVYDEYERNMYSYSAMAQPNDSTPPDIPVNLRGLILDDGQVIISWDENTEDDLLGYRLWWANQKEDEYTLMTGTPITNNFFVDQTVLNTLTPNMYIKIVALDYRHNTSDFSEAVVIARPDTIPPAAPLLTNISGYKDSLVVEWAMSRSADLKMHELYRRPLGDTSWQLIKTYMNPENANINRYQETTTQAGDYFEYRLDAIDWTGLRSVSKTLQGARVDNFIRKPIQRLSATPDRREHHISLSWNYQPERDNFSYFEVYRSREGKPAQIIKTLSSEAATVIATRKGGFRYQYNDANALRMNTNYRYQIRAVYSDGGQSRLDEGVIVNY